MDIGQYREIFERVKTKGVSSREELKKNFKLTKEQNKILLDWIELERYWAYQNGNTDGKDEIRRDIKSILEIGDSNY